MRSFLAALVLVWPLPALAEPPYTLDMQALVSAMSEPWRNGVDFEQELTSVLPELSIVADATPAVPDDPFAWVRDGFFATVPGIVPIGGYVICSRYGIATRDFLAANDLSDPGTFRLFSLYQIEHDEAEAWPDGAVARVSCQITWDDTRAVTILPESGVRAVLDRHFDSVQSTIPAGQADFYGEQGYRWEGHGGRQDTVLYLDRMVIVLTTRHQAVRIRSFLMNGGS